MNAEIADVRERRGRAKDAFEAELNEKAGLPGPSRSCAPISSSSGSTRRRGGRCARASTPIFRRRRSLAAQAMAEAKLPEQRSARSSREWRRKWHGRRASCRDLHGETKFLARCGGAHAEDRRRRRGLPADAGPALAGGASQKVRLQDLEAAHERKKILLAAAEGVDVTGAAEESGPLVEGADRWALGVDEVPPTLPDRSSVDKDSTPGSTKRRRDRDGAALRPLVPWANSPPATLQIAQSRPCCPHAAASGRSRPDGARARYTSAGAAASGNHTDRCREGAPSVATPSSHAAPPNWPRVRTGAAVHRVPAKPPPPLPTHRRPDIVAGQ